ncbi:MAG: AAA family ATPase [bacterium]|nr:AAA family ATPase [bacterium]
MQKISNYHILEQLCETVESISYRCKKENDDTTFLLKMFKTGTQTPLAVARFKQEYDIIKNIPHKGIVKVHNILTEKDQYGLVLEDFDGISFQEAFVGNAIKVGTFLPAAIKLAEILGNLHKKNIIHKNIKPQSILINRESFEIKITDFGASFLLNNDANIDPAQRIEKLVYISPEQTGRINRSVDYRTDLYSLGAVFYHLITGEVPFISTDPMEMIHSHIARSPQAPAEKNPGIPLMISNIIMKLLSKTVEERYLNSFGLMADLQECLKQLRDNGKIETFTTGRKDHPVKYMEPEELIGREEEIDFLIRSFDENAGILLVSGPPGIGKTVLINEIRKPVTARRGYFISGKYDLLNRDMPYIGMIRAFRGLVRQILSESETAILQWKENLLKVLGPNGKVITDIIPEVEFIIGEQPGLAELEPEESKNRFNLVFGNFTALFAKENHPLVLFLDDLQWADIASLKLMKNLISNAALQYLFIIGAYRDTEVPAGHPLAEIIKDMENAGMKISRLGLLPLREQDVGNIIIDSLQCEEDRAVPLAEQVFKKTGGNPFFVNQFLRILYHEELLEIDAIEGWQWNLEKIKEMQVTANVVDLMVGKINKLAEKPREALKICACIGSRFDLETVAVMRGLSIDKALLDLTEVLNEGLIGMSGDEYIFHHDKIQEAAYLLIPQEDKGKLHYRIGKIALEKTRKENRFRGLFYITDQLNLGSGYITAGKELEELAALNFKAGIKAKASAAYSPAFGYLRTGIGFLEEECWEKQYDLALALYTESTETAYLKGDFEEMERLADIVIKHAGNVIDKVKIFEIKIYAYKAQEDFHGAIRIGLSTLKLLGIRIPEKPAKFRILLELLKRKLALAGKKPEELIDLPKMTNPQMLSASQILASVATVAYYAAPTLPPLIIFKLIHLARKYGHAPEHASAYIGYGLLMVAAFGNIESGYKFANLGLNLVDKLNARGKKTMTAYLYNVFIRHWKESIRDSTSQLLEIYQTGLETGDLGYAALSLLLQNKYSFQIGKDLRELSRDMDKHYQAIEGIGQAHALQIYSIYQQAVFNLLGENENPAQLSGTALDGEKSVPQWIKANHRVIVCEFYHIRLQLRYLFQKYSLALEDLIQAEKYFDKQLRVDIIRSYMYYNSLVMLASYQDASVYEKKIYRKKVLENQAKMKEWSEYCPENNLHRFHLVAAEQARIFGENSLAEESYDTAISLSNKYKYVNDEAIANELAAKFYLSRGKERIARIYIVEAYNCYSRWGAIAKIQQIEKLYSKFLSTPGNELSGLSGGMHHYSGSSELLDLSTAMKASQAISGEIDLGKLLARMMEIVMENAGADKGFMILEDMGKLLVEAEGSVESEEIILLKSIPVDDHEGLSPSIVNYVARTKETLILNNASLEGDFTDAPYVVKNQPKSILCAPILNQGKLSGIVYLENNLTTGAFTPDRLEILNLLSSQAAVSLDNARLYHNLEEKVKERTSELAEAYEKLKELDRAKTDFFANISHEIRSPLSLIHSPIESIVQGDYGNSIEKNHSIFKTMRQNSARLLKLINDLLDFSRIEAGRMSIKREKTDVAKLLEYYVNSIESGADSRKLNIRFNNNCGRVFAQIDRDLMGKALVNLLTNALKFTPAGGSILVELDSKEDRFSISVRDTGIGIPVNKQDIIFERFRQVDSSSSRKYEGSGIGLALTKEIVELHEGAISVESSPGKGSVFLITIPFIYSENNPDSLSEEYPDIDIIDSLPWEEPVNSTKDNSGKQENILIVDDNPGMLNFLRNLLEKEYYIETAQNGRKALEKLSREIFRPDLILADVMMPEMDGYEFTRAIRRDPGFEGLPIILLTARAATSMKIEGLKKGANDYIVKPFNPKELMMRIQSQLELKLLRDRLLEANESLQQTITDSSILVSDIGHRFNSELSPFSALIMLGKKMISEISSGEKILDEDELEFAEELFLECEESLDRIEEMKNKIKNNFGKKSERVFNKIKYILSNVLNNYSDIFKREHIILEKDFNFDPEKELKINSEQVKIALENILDNSIQAFGPSGNNKKISVRAGSVNNNFLIEIEDNGPGMPQEVRENIFNLFYSTKKKKAKQGLGLGLYLTHWIIEDCHKGKIEVESEEGEYTQFKIFLPEEGDPI